LPHLWSPGLDARSRCPPISLPQAGKSGERSAATRLRDEVLPSHSRSPRLATFGALQLPSCVVDLSESLHPKASWHQIRHTQSSRQRTNDAGRPQPMANSFRPDRRLHVRVCMRLDSERRAEGWRAAACYLAGGRGETSARDDVHGWSLCLAAWSWLRTSRGSSIKGPIVAITTIN